VHAQPVHVLVARGACRRGAQDLKSPESAGPTIADGARRLLTLVCEPVPAGIVTRMDLVRPQHIPPIAMAAEQPGPCGGQVSVATMRVRLCSDPLRGYNEFITAEASRPS
jgi:hypothetical protein